LYKEKSRPETALDAGLVEAAGIEPASASTPPRGLHACFVINLTCGCPTNEEDRKPAQLGFNVRALNIPSRDLAYMTPGIRTHKHVPVGGLKAGF